MSRTYSAEMTRSVAADPASAYGVIADYREGHARILPPQFFRSLEVLEGGYGAGTVVRAVAKGLGRDVVYNLAVTEPEPGRVLLETDQALGIQTTFTVEPEPGGSRVTIRTVWPRRPGLKGWLDERTNRWAAPMVYRAELDLLAKALT